MNLPIASEYFYKEELGICYISKKNHPWYKIPSWMIITYPPQFTPEEIFRQALKESQYVDFEEVEYYPSIMVETIERGRNKAIEKSNEDLS